MVALGVCAAMVFIAGGCETKGFFNPGEVGRFKKEPLLLPILSSLETGTEEPNDQFAGADDVKPEDLVSNAEDYVVGRNDLLAISITDLVAPGVETVKSARVSESGNISLPLIGQIRAEALTEAQLEAEIQRAYREANLMPNAQVSVTVQQALARTFSILGSVSRPGQYQITQADFRILDALVTAGDVSAQGVDYLYVIRRRDTGTDRPSTAPATGTGPGTAPAAPGDTLTPRSDATQMHLKTIAHLVQDAAPAVPAPADPAAAPAANPAAPGAGGEGRYIIVDGKPVLVGNQGAAAEPNGAAPAAAAAPAAPAPGTPAAPADPAIAPATTPGFEFDGPNTGTNSRIIRVPVTQLKNGDLRYNMVIRAQDMIIAPLPVTGEYFMDGHINRSGVYSLTARNITLKQAVAAAGGFDQLAIPTRTEVIRRIGQDREVFARVDLDKVFAGQQPDIYLKPNDVVRVGTNAIAPFLASFRNAFRMTYGFGFLYDRNYAPQRNNGL
jgi:protein involved in polysaccharide export with SLBB domain